jgi:CRISPR-associated protein Csm1
LTQIFRNPQNNALVKGEKSRRAVTTIYAGGDDLFVVGSWNDIVETSIDIVDELNSFSHGTLTISGGIGVYSENYPIGQIAIESGNLEDASKHHPDGKKNALALFEEANRYHWSDFESDIIKNKFDMITNYFEKATENGLPSASGNSFLYRLIDFARNKNQEGGQINLARFAYTVSRLAPKGKFATPEMKESYATFSKKMYEWVKDDAQINDLVLASLLHVYKHRNEGKENG